MKPIPLATVRPFGYTEVVLSDYPDELSPDCQQEQLETFLKRKVRD